MHFNKILEFGVDNLLEKLEKSYKYKQPMNCDVLPINFSKKLPAVLKNKLVEWSNILEARKEFLEPKYIFFTNFFHIVTFNFIRPVFENSSLDSMWHGLERSSTQKTLLLVEELLIIFSAIFFDRKERINKAKEDLKESERLFVYASKLCDFMEKYEKNYYYIARLPPHDDLKKILKNYIYMLSSEIPLYKKPRKIINPFKDNLLSGNNIKKKDLEIIFLKYISGAFIEIFNKPKYKHTADIVNVIFNSSYDYKNVSSIVTRLSH